MRAVVQRVSEASVSVSKDIVGEISQGLVVLLGVADGDTETDAKFMAEKISGLRIFEDDEGKMNLAYEVTDGMPGFVTRAVNDWTVVPVSKNQSRLVMKAEFRSKGVMGKMMNGMMEKKMSETLETVLMDAKIYAETGEISPAKQERIASLSKKAA